jgi:hypothetical protein
MAKGSLATHEPHQAPLARCGDGDGRDRGDTANCEPGARRAGPAVTGPDVAGRGAVQHNVTYRARDGTSRGAVVAYKIDDNNVNSDQPTLLPGMTFEVNTVLDDPKNAGMEISIQWPYGSNLHCEILVDDQIVAQADQFIAPRLLRPKNDPLYGTLQCGAPLDTSTAGGGTDHLSESRPPVGGVRPGPCAPVESRNQGSLACA